MSGRALIILGGASEIPKKRANDIVICADSGFIAAMDHTIEVDHLVGDMDSIPSSYLRTARDHGVEIHEYSTDKERSDGEIAMEMAIDKGYDEIIISGGKDGRFDHVLSTLYLPFLLKDGVDVEIWIDQDRILLLKEGRKESFSGKWKVVTILPLQEGCRVSTEGLKWALRSESIDRGSTRGLHNEPTEDSFSIHCEAGSIFVILSNRP
jgi:thiamine pyrophosphokinase